MTRAAAELLARAEESDRELSDVWDDLKDLGAEVDLAPDRRSGDADSGFEVHE